VSEKKKRKKKGVIIAHLVFYQECCFMFYVQTDLIVPCFWSCLVLSGSVWFCLVLFILFKHRCATLNGLDMGVGYGQACDMWSCGVVLYILVCQGMPFSTEEGAEMEEATAVSEGNIKNWAFVFHLF